jgi:hypothetical protein
VPPQPSRTTDAISPPKPVCAKPTSQDGSTTTPRENAISSYMEDVGLTGTTSSHRTYVRSLALESHASALPTGLLSAEWMETPILMNAD